MAYIREHKKGSGKYCVATTNVDEHIARHDPKFKYARTKGFLSPEAAEKKKKEIETEAQNIRNSRKK